jgi:hypothetical protein
VICGGKEEAGFVGLKHVVLNRILRHEEATLELCKDG